ncbi:MAG: PIN domain-containing protein [Anaerolineales bacterium]
MNVPDGFPAESDQPVVSDGGCGDNLEKTTLNVCAHQTLPEEITVVVADPTDNNFLEAAVAGKADLIVSGDGHLLDLKVYREIPIITAREFIVKLENQ